MENVNFKAHEVSTHLANRTNQLKGVLKTIKKSVSFKMGKSLI